MSEWNKVAMLDDIPHLGARRIKAGTLNIALFRDSENSVFAMEDRCPHKGGPLSQGIVCGHKVTCPLHGWNIGLEDGLAVAPDKGQVLTYPVRIDQGVVYLKLKS
jgi:nitrite reductase (NADH) small subunit